MLLYPKFYYKNVQSIDLNMLYDIGIRGIILDVDNTLIDYKEVMPDGIKEWVKIKILEYVFFQILIIKKKFLRWQKY